MDKNLKNPENIDKLIRVQSRQGVTPIPTAAKVKVKSIGMYKKERFNRNSK